MRTFLLLFALLFSASLKAQTYQPVSFMDNTLRTNFTNSIRLNDSIHKKWFVSKYAGISTGFSFYKGGNAGFIAAPMGLQLNRTLSNNVFAFAGISAAPAYINSNQTFFSADMNKSMNNKNTFNSNAFGFSSRAELGLMYVNDARTFSISGSIGVERSYYPAMPYNQMNTIRPSTAIIPNDDKRLH